jgi:uncharacterized protein YcbK (DUF882 family)
VATDDGDKRDEPASASDGGAGELAELRAKVEQLEQERDKAISARDYLVREVLAGGKPPEEAKPRGRAALWALALFLLVGGVMLAVQMARTSRRAREAARSPAQPRVGTASDRQAAPAPRASFSARRLAVIPVTELDLVTAVALAPRGDLVAVGGLDGKVALYDLERDRTVRLFKAHGEKGGVRALVFSGSSSLFTGGADGAVHQWNVKTGARGATVRRGGAAVRGMALCRGRSLAVAAEQPEVELFTLNRRAAPTGVRKLRGHQSWVRAVACSPDGRLLASGGHDGKIRIWSAESGALARTLEGHGLWVTALAFSPDGKRLASGGFDRRLRLWEVASGRQLRKLWGHIRYLVGLAFDRTGRLLVSASADRTARVWGVSDGTSRAHLIGHLRGLVGVAVHPSGKTVLTASGDGTLRLWPYPLPLTQTERPLPPPGPGELTLRSYTAGERVRVRVVDNDGNVLERGRRQLAWIMRSSTDDRMEPPKPALVALLYRVAEHFGRQREVTVISGYRSPEYNALRTRQSKQVGKESRHMKGEAMDIRIEGVPITRLHRYLLSLKASGVGYYADSQFCHVDVGPFRTWSGD